MLSKKWSEYKFWLLGNQVKEIKLAIYIFQERSISKLQYSTTINREKQRNVLDFVIAFVRLNNLHNSWIKFCICLYIAYIRLIKWFWLSRKGTSLTWAEEATVSTTTFVKCGRINSGTLKNERGYFEMFWYEIGKTFILNRFVAVSVDFGNWTKTFLNFDSHGLFIIENSFSAFLIAQI